MNVCWEPRACPGIIKKTKNKQKTGEKLVIMKETIILCGDATVSDGFQD